MNLIDNLLKNLKKVSVTTLYYIVATLQFLSPFKNRNMDDEHFDEEELRLEEELALRNNQFLVQPPFGMEANNGESSDDEDMEYDDISGEDSSSSDSEVSEVDEEEEELDEEEDASADEVFTNAHNSTQLRSFTNTRFDLKKKRLVYAFKPLCLIKCYSIDPKDDSDVSIPVARSGHRVIASESHLYSLGGYNPRSAVSAARDGRCLLFQELWSYNFATHRWRLIIWPKKTTEMPAELASTALALYNNVLISHGGTGYPFGETCSNDCYVYTTNEHNALVARLRTTGDLPTAQYGPSIVIHNDYLYTIGGTTGFDYSCDVYRLNLKTKVWESVYICRPEMRDDPEGRYRHEVVYDGQYIYILGGGTSNSVYDLERIPAFNLKDNTWVFFNTLPDQSVVNEELANGNPPDRAGYPKSRKCFSCVQHTLPNGDIEAFITGGLQGDFSTYFADIWKLHIRTKQWTLIRTAKLPKPLYFHAAAHAGNNCMYIFGGIEYTVKDMRRRKDLYKMWLTIPKLSEICWDAITYYNDNLHYFKRNTLLKAGIPSKFLERLPQSKLDDPKSSKKRLRLDTV